MAYNDHVTRQLSLQSIYLFQSNRIHFSFLHRAYSASILDTTFIKKYSGMLIISSIRHLSYFSHFQLFLLLFAIESLSAISLMLLSEQS